MLQNSVSKAVFERLPVYLEYLKNLEGIKYTSSAKIAEDLGFGSVQVRKDLALVTLKGKPKVGHQVSNLIHAIEIYMGYDAKTDVILVGTGQLGKALYRYQGFKDFGINIVQAFDIYEGKNVLSIEQLKGYCNQHDIRVGIITVPKEQAQIVADKMIEAGIRAIWNYAPIRLVIPNNVIVQNENMATSLSILIKQMNEESVGNK